MLFFLQNICAKIIGIPVLMSKNLKFNLEYIVAGLFTLFGVLLLLGELLLLGDLSL